MKKTMRRMKTPNELGISLPERSALMGYAEMLRSGQIKHAKVNEDGEYKLPKEFEFAFNLETWFNAHPWIIGNKQATCGSVGCIGGGTDFYFGTSLSLTHEDNEELHELFYPAGIEEYAKVTPKQAAKAIDNFLYTGQARWSSVVKNVR